MVRSYSSVRVLLAVKIFILIYSSLCFFSSIRWLRISLTARPGDDLWAPVSLIHPAFGSQQDRRLSFSTLVTDYKNKIFKHFTFPCLHPLPSTELIFTFFLWRNHIYFKYKCPPILFSLYKLATVGLARAEVWRALNQISMSNDDSGSEDEGFICLFFIWSQQSAETDFPH